MSVEKQVTEFVGQSQGEMTALLGDLVAIPSVNPPGRSYRECAGYLSEQLNGWGIRHQTLEIPQGEYPRFCLLGSHGEGEPGIHLHGHYDVVAAQSSGQFLPLERDGRLYGRGSSDMKGGIVAMLFALRAVKACGVRLTKKVTLTLVPDEETGGGLGMRYLASEGRLPNASVGMLMPEPTSGVIWHASRGALTLRLRVKGKPAHVGLAHQGVNAFEHMVEVAHSLQKLKRRVEARQTSLAIHPPEASRSVMLVGGESGSGVNFNVVPEGAYFSIDRRINPEESLTQAKEEMNRIFERHRKRGLDIEVDIVQEGEPSVAAKEAPLGLSLAKAVEEVTGDPPAFELCPGILETRFFSNRGIPGYAYGPGLLHVSHGPEEYIALRDLVNCAQVYALTLIRMLAD
jgi:acetylornithine deacetylase/succinyl-diaminopimelate desuccinylase family protein